MKNPFIIAEIAQGYEGDAKLAEFYIKAAASSGADAIKFHIFYADELALRDYKYYDLFKNLELPFRVWERCVKLAHKLGIMFYSDVLGRRSLKKLVSIGVDGFKIHSTDVNNLDFIQMVAKSKKKVLLSTGGCSESEIGEAIEVLKMCDITLMHGFQAEPTQIEDNHLNRLTTLKNRFRKAVGFQDHTAGEDALSFYLPFIAIGLGATVIEKHLTLSRKAQIEDYISALTPEEFFVLTNFIKKSYRSLGKDSLNLTNKELAYRTKVRRAVCTVDNINKGKVISKKDVVFKRSGAEDVFHDLSFAVGKIAKRNIKKNSAIKKGDLL